MSKERLWWMLVFGGEYFLFSTSFHSELNNILDDYENSRVLTLTLLYTILTRRYGRSSSASGDAQKTSAATARQTRST